MAPFPLNEQLKTRTLDCLIPYTAPPEPSTVPLVLVILAALFSNLDDLMMRSSFPEVAATPPKLALLPVNEQLMVRTAPHAEVKIAPPPPMCPSLLTIVLFSKDEDILTSLF